MSDPNGGDERGGWTAPGAALPPPPPQYPPPQYPPPQYPPPQYPPPQYPPPQYPPPQYPPPQYPPPQYPPPQYPPPQYPPPQYPPPQYPPPQYPPPQYPGGYGWTAPPQPKAGDARTGPLPLHPMTVADILDGAFKLLKANMTTLAVIVAVLVVPFHILAALLERNLFGGHSVLTTFRDPSAIAVASRSSQPLRQEALSAVVGLVNLLLLPFVAGAVSVVVSASYLGQRLAPAVALRAALNRFFPLLGAWWLIHVAEVVAAFACVLPAFAVMAMFVLTAPAIVCEHLGPVQGMRRSWALVRGRFWPTLGTALLAGLMAYVLGQILGVVPTLLGFVVGLHWGWILVAAGNSLVALIATPIVAIVATLLYFDARIRTEGFDLQVIAAGLAAGAG